MREHVRAVTPDAREGMMKNSGRYPMKRLIMVLVSLAVSMCLSVTNAHHSVPMEFGGSEQETHYIEGEVLEVGWRAPHISVTLEITGGEVTPGEIWKINSHAPVLMKNSSEIAPGEVKVGDMLKVRGWFHLRGLPAFHIRALSINDGPMRSTLRNADLRDLAKGTLGDIVPPSTLTGFKVRRLDDETLQKLKDQGVVSEDNTVTGK